VSGGSYGGDVTDPVHWNRPRRITQAQLDALYGMVQVGGQSEAFLRTLHRDVNAICGLEAA
jgi:hypothetical protein